MEHVIACVPTKLNHILGVPKGEGIEVSCVKCGEKVWLLDAAMKSVRLLSKETPTVLCIPCVAKVIEDEGQPIGIIPITDK